MCQPRYPPGCTCDPFSPDPDSSCPGQQTCKQCKCLGEWFIVSTVHTCLHGVHVSNVSLGLIMLPPPLCKASYPLSTHLLCFVFCLEQSCSHSQHHLRNHLCFNVITLYTALFTPSSEQRLNHYHISAFRRGSKPIISNCRASPCHVCLTFYNQFDNKNTRKIHF